MYYGEPIYCVGSINYDVLTTPTKKAAYLGGSAANTAYFLHNLFPKYKNSIFLVGLIGNDENAKYVKNQLEKKHINQKYIQIMEGKTGSTHISVDKNGERYIEREKSVTSYLKSYIEQEFIKNVLNGGLIHFKGSIEVLEQLLKINPNLLSCDISGIIPQDPKNFRQNIDIIFENRSIEILFGNQEEFLQIYNALFPDTQIESITNQPIHKNMQISNQLLTLFKSKAMCLKMGENGAMIFTPNYAIFTKTPNIIPIDTTGAGDAFNAGFLYKYLEKRNYLQALKYGCAMGSLNCTQFGGQELEITPNQLDEIVKSELF